MRGKVLLLEERELILRGICEKLSDRAIGRRIGRNQSVISREIANNGGRDRYSPSAAQERADRLRARPKARKLVANTWLHDVVAAGLADDRSPEQIAGRLTQEYPDEPDKHVSHETIYETLYLQARGELKTELKLALRTGRLRRVARGSSRPKQARIRAMVNVSERPAEAADRAVPGHWEGDRATWKAAHCEWSYRFGGSIVEGMTRFSVSRTVPALACVASNRGVRSPGETPKDHRSIRGLRARGRPDG